MAGPATQGGTKTENLKACLAVAESEEKARAKGEEGHKGRGNMWRIFLRLVQRVWKTGNIPHQMQWVVIVLIPKGNSGNFYDIGLLDPICKVLKKMFEVRLTNLECHDCLHNFPANRSRSTTALEAKLAQQLAFRE